MSGNFQAFRYSAYIVTAVKHFIFNFYRSCQNYLCSIINVSDHFY